MRGDPGGHQRRRAIAVDGDAGDVEPAEDRYGPAEVVALLAAGQAAPTDEVLDLRALELWQLLQHLRDYIGREVVRPDVDEGPLASPADRRAAQSSDHSSIHAPIITPCRASLFQLRRAPEMAMTTNAIRSKPMLPSAMVVPTLLQAARNRTTTSAGSHSAPASSQPPRALNAPASLTSSRGRHSRR